MKRHNVTSALVGAALSALLFSSCKATYYQVYETRPSALNTTLSRVTDVVYEDENVRVMYNMWTENGYPGYAVTNLTDEMLYVDKELSFLRLNGITHPYYQGLTFTESSALTTSSQKSSFFEKLQSGFGLFVTYEPDSPEKRYADNTKSKYTGSMIQSGLASTNGWAVTRSETKDLIIPPGHTATMTIQGHIIDGIFVDCDMNYTPKKKSPSSRSFNEVNSPITFDNMMTYRVGKDGKDILVNVGFYVATVTNYVEDAIVVKEKVKGKDCKGLRELNSIFGWTNYYNTQAAPNRFFYIYRK